MRVRLRASDVSSVARHATAARRAALGVVAENALADTEPYVPYETGALVGSGTAEVGASGDRATLSYGGDADTARYARRQYSEPHDHSTAANAAHSPRATDHWCEASARENGDRWRAMLAEGIERGLS